MATCAQTTLAFISMPGGWEWIIILVIGLLLFGRRLPEIGRSVGKTIVEFKKGMANIDEEVAASTRPSGGATASPSAGELPGSQGAAPGSERRVGTHDPVER